MDLRPWGRAAAPAGPTAPHDGREPEARGSPRRRNPLESGVSRRTAQNSPTVSPCASTSIAYAAGVFPRPGIVIMSPHSATIHPAPV